MSNALFTRYRGRVQGPFTFDQLLVLARRGQFTRTHEVSTDGTSWSRASNYPELFPTAQPVSMPELDEPVVEVSQQPEKHEAQPATAPPQPVPQWHYMTEGESKGPVDFTYLIYLVNSQQLSPDDLVWKDGFPSWIPASQVPGLVRPNNTSANVSTVSSGATTLVENTFPRVSALAVASLVLGILGACPPLNLLAIIFGAVAIHQIRISRGQIRGNGLAIAGLSLGIVWLGFQVLYLVTVVVAGVAAQV